MESRDQTPAGHDACGVGFIAHLRGRSGRDIVSLGLAALRRLTHRGATATLGAVDGCGVLTAIPWPFLEAAFAGGLPAARTRALGMLFVHPSDRPRAAAIVDAELRAAGARFVEWRLVPTDRLAVLRAQRHTTPRVLQVAAGFEEARATVDAALYRARLRIEHTARDAGARLTIVSLSTRTLVYKGLVTPDALPEFYPDLDDERFASPFITFHQRFSTNTSADWALAQPFRTLAHNGEINTIAGNRRWMQARVADAASMPARIDGAVVSGAGSDSQSLDDAIELMRHHGYTLAHAVTRLVPPAWERDRDLPPDVRAFYEFQSLLSEPWDGPSALVFADGRHVGAALDRNGFRPARVVTTSTDLIAVASEVGILPADEHDIIDRKRLGPGDMILVDLDRGGVIGTHEIRRRLALRRRYRRLVEDIVEPLEPMATLKASPDIDQDIYIDRDVARVDVAGRATLSGSPYRGDDLVRLQTAFGCSREEIELLLKPMIADGHEAVGSMGDDTPPAVLSSRSRLLTDFFRQRFAQVTNPSVDPYRESAVMSLTTVIGGHGDFIDELAVRPKRVVLRSPILGQRQLAQLQATSALAPATLATVCQVSDAHEHVVPPNKVSDTRQIETTLRGIVEQACAAVEAGSALIVLSDRRVDREHAAVPALLATAAVHHALIDRGLRMRASLVVDTGDARDAHQLAVLFAYGASAVCPWLGIDTVASFEEIDETGCDVAPTRYRLALERGLRTLMSKMGVCTFSGYCGAQLVEILGLDRTLADRFFPGTASPLGGATLDDVAATALERHRRAFAPELPIAEYPGLHGYRRNGEYHATNPLVVRGLQKARDESHNYELFKSHVHGRPAAAVRDLVEFAPARAAALDDVEPVDSICRRFFASAMSVGALSPEAHRTIATAMNQIGARSNSGEGGEEPDRYGQPDGNRTKQVASARFGVTAAYLRSADELQIKIAQGSKPGEGGQLPGMKVVPHIARLRHAQPGATLISPPVHHDIYSIEDLAQLIFDLRAVHPTARISVKLVASVGVGVIATGVAKAGADAIQISGHDGGTGASPRASIKHAGMPWEVGLAEAHEALTRAGLRHRVVLQTDGGLKTGRDIAVAAALGADEYGFGTAALVAIGCVMARQCHANTCPVGIATQRDDLRAGFDGTPEMLIGYLKLVAGEVREILASLGLRRLADLVGRADLLRRREGVALSVDLGSLIRGLGIGDWGLANREPRTENRQPRTPNAECRTHVRSELLDTVSPDTPLTFSGTIANTDRAFGAGVAGEIAARFGDAGLPSGSVQMAMTGSAGQSFGAFAVQGMRLTLIGDANDGVGKGMSGGEIAIAPAARERGRAQQVLVGNAALYGATGGRLFVAGAAGERFAIRNSGALAIVEGVGDHACEYMTGGVVIVLGAIGRNFAAGMTGGVAYVACNRSLLTGRTHPQQLAIEAPSVADQRIVRELLDAHERLTGSRVARVMLRNDRLIAGLWKVSPVQAASAPTVLGRAEPFLEAAPFVEAEPAEAVAVNQ